MCRHSSQIAIIWSAEDIQFVRRDLSDEQCMRVLQRIERNHDADYGVTWDTIRTCADHMFPKTGK